MGLFSRKTVVPETDGEKAKKELFQMVRSLSLDSQKSYKVFLRYHRVGETYKNNTIYYIFQGRLIRVPK